MKLTARMALSASLLVVAAGPAFAAGPKTYPAENAAIGLSFGAD